MRRTGCEGTLAQVSHSSKSAHTESVPRMGSVVRCGESTQTCGRTPKVRIHEEKKPCCCAQVLSHSAKVLKLLAKFGDGKDSGSFAFSAQPKNRNETHFEPGGDMRFGVSSDLRRRTSSPRRRRSSRRPRRWSGRTTGGATTSSACRRRSRVSAVTRQHKHTPPAVCPRESPRANRGACDAPSSRRGS